MYNICGFEYFFKMVLKATLITLYSKIVTVEMLTLELFWKLN